jgi:hypothetical protein
MVQNTGTAEFTWVANLCCMDTDPDVKTVEYLGREPIDLETQRSGLARAHWSVRNGAASSMNLVRREASECHLPFGIRGIRL